MGKNRHERPCRPLVSLSLVVVLFACDQKAALDKETLAVIGDRLDTPDLDTKEEFGKNSVPGTQ
ncbi:MAG: hypothetical protein HY897_22415 [Deltaproteobacteria bacterium]|nr:hypothetical protein [Deltaproteobacteria bacterium]